MRVMKAHDADAGSPLVCFGEVVARDPFYLLGRPDLADFRLADLGQLRFASVSEVPTPGMPAATCGSLASIRSKLRASLNGTMADNVAALREGRLDVVQLFEPFVAQAIRGGFC